jgi:antitoxin (DNA-binding transcriptional repressor) of toxin-antitoxin stability system
MVITRHGRPVARLVPAAVSEEARIEAAIRALKSFRQGATLGGLSCKELRGESRR